MTIIPLYNIESVELDPTLTTTLPLLKRCPFCGMLPYWKGIVHNPATVVPHFYHPGVATDRTCILAGRGFSALEAGTWNLRHVES